MSPSPITTRQERIAAYWMLLACAAFAPMAAFIKLASTKHGISDVLLIRGAIGASMFWLLAKFAGVSLRTQFPWRHAKRTVIGIAAVGAWIYAISVLPLATAYMLYHTSSLWLVVAALISAVAVAWKTPRLSQSGLQLSGQSQPKPSSTDWSMATVTTKSILSQTQLSPRERINLIWARQWPLALAILIGFVGMALVLSPGFGGAQPTIYLVGVSAGLIAAWAINTVASLGKQGEPEARIGFWFMTSTAVVGLIGVSANQLVGTDESWDWEHGQYLLYAAVLAAVGQWALTKAYASGSPLLAANFQYFGVLFASLIGIFIFDEPLSVSTALGIGILVSSAAGATWIRAKQDRRGQAAATQSTKEANK